MTNAETELEEAVYGEIKRLCASGDRHAKAQAFPDALQDYWKAYDLLPEPKTKWSAATWILATIGDVNFQGRDYVAGKDNLSLAMHCPDAIGNPWLHLRLGQCQFELGNLERAADELMRAYMGAGEEIFLEDGEKYLAFLRTRAKGIGEPPPKKPRWKFW